MKQKILYPMLLFLLIAIGVILALSYSSEGKRVNYLIPHVPYYGIYEHYLIHNNLVTNVMMILDYYGDERFTINNQESLDQLLDYLVGYDDDRRLINVERFFKSMGYETSLISDTPQELMSEIRKFINDDARTPVIVYQKRSADPQYKSMVLRTVIGVFDNEKKIVVHDYNFGNNWELSRETFVDLFSNNSGSMLVVQPSAELAPLLKGVNTDYSYPERIPAMNSSIASDFAGHLGDIQLLIEGAEEEPEQVEKYYEAAVADLDKTIGSSHFSDMHPTIRIELLLGKARFLIGLKKYDETIGLINNEIIPLNHDLDKAQDGWVVISYRYRGGTDPLPYLILGVAYRYKGDFEKAFESFEDGWKINSTDYSWDAHRRERTAFLAYRLTYASALRTYPEDPTALRWKERVESVE